MLKNISKILIAGYAIVALQPLYSMEIYTVKSGDYLYKIAKSHTVTGISTGELTDSIKGINKSEVPGIVDNRIKIGDKLAIPTTKDEVEDGLTLVRNEMVQGTYNASNVSQTPKVIGGNDSESDTSNLGDQAMVSNQATTSNTQVTPSQNAVPNMMPSDDTQVVTYGNDLDSKINSQDIQETQSNNDNNHSSSAFNKLIKFIFVVIILLGLFIFGKRFWDNRSSRKEQELEILSKKKRDHLMSRISPVVSDSDFYKADDTHHGPQEAFDFSTAIDGSKPNKIVSENIGHGKELEEKVNLDSDISELTNADESEDQETIESPESNDIALDDKFESDKAQKSTISPSVKSTAVKTSKGVVFETVSDDSFKKVDNLVEEIDTEIYEEDEMRYVEELVEQYLDGEKYMEASITVQDSLEKSPNNIDLRFMLLEVYARAGDEIAFDGEVHLIKSKNIVSMFDPLHQKIAKLKDKYFE